MAGERAYWVLERTESPKFPYRLSIVRGEAVLLALLVGDRWPGSKGNIFCFRDDPCLSPEPLEEVERVPVVNMRRYGKRLSIVLDRTRRKRCDFLFLEKRYKDGRGTYEQIFWQTQKGLKERKTKTRFAVYNKGEDALHIVIDAHERYPWRFAGCREERSVLPAGDYALLENGEIAAVVERKTMEDMVSSLSNLRILHQAVSELEAYPLSALVIEAEYADFLKPDKIRPLNPSYCARAFAELVALHASVIVHFAGSRKLANFWTLAFFRAVSGMKEEPQFQLPLEMPAYVRSPALQSRVSLRVRDALRELPEEFRFRELREKLYDVPEAALRRALNGMRDLGQVECRGKGKTARWVRNAAF